MSLGILPNCYYDCVQLVLYLPSRHTTRSKHLIRTEKEAGGDKITLQPPKNWQCTRTPEVAPRLLSIHIHTHWTAMARLDSPHNH